MRSAISDLSVLSSIIETCLASLKFPPKKQLSLLGAPNLQNFFLICTFSFVSIVSPSKIPYDLTFQVRSYRVGGKYLYDQRGSPFSLIVGTGPLIIFNIFPLLKGVTASPPEGFVIFALSSIAFQFFYGIPWFKSLQKKGGTRTSSQFNDEHFSHQLSYGPASL